MKLGLYAGSFNPWHIGHEDILDKALDIFDKIVILVCQNPEKPESEIDKRYKRLHDKFKMLPARTDKVDVRRWNGTIKGFLSYYKEQTGESINAMVRGLRNPSDLGYEMDQMGLHEDTGNRLPYVCFLGDRKYRHVSSTAIRGLDKLGLKHEYTDRDHSI